MEQQRIQLDQFRYQMEMAAFEEKIALSELEEAKTSERTKELKYERTRFQMEWLTHIARAQEQAQMSAVQAKPQG